MGPNPGYVEALCIGGGYGDPADGGIDLEKNGTIRTNGHLTVDGIINAGQMSVTGRCETGPSTSMLAGFRIPPGAAPASPLDGDIWTTTAGIYVRIHGVTVGPLGAGGGGATDWGNPGTIGATTPNTGAFTTLTATGNLVCGGDVSVNGGDITSTASLLNLTGGGDVRINAGGTDRNVKFVPTGTGGVWCGLQGNGTLFAAKIGAGSMGSALLLQCYSGTEAVIIDPQVAGQANLHVGALGLHNGNAELFGNNAALGGRLVLHRGATATGVSAYSLQPGNTGILHVNNGSENIVSIDGNTRRVGVNTAAPSVTLDVAGAGRFSGRVETAASSTTGAGLSIPHGSAPTIPVNGDVWTTPTGVYFHINGRTLEAFSGETDWANPGIIGSSIPNEATFTTLIVSDSLRVPSSTEEAAGFRIVQGVSPVAPFNGDVWITAQGMYLRANNRTMGPLIDASDLAVPPCIGYGVPNGGRFTNLEATGCITASPGTASAPSLKMRSGIAPAIPETGDVWADEEGFYFRIAGKTLKLRDAWHAVGVSW